MFKMRVPSLPAPPPPSRSSDLLVWSGLHDLSFQEVAWEFPGPGKLVVLNAANHINQGLPLRPPHRRGPETLSNLCAVAQPVRPELASRPANPAVCLQHLLPPERTTPLSGPSLGQLFLILRPSTSFPLQVPGATHVFLGLKQPLRDGQICLIYSEVSLPLFCSRCHIPRHASPSAVGLPHPSGTVVPSAQ